MKSLNNNEDEKDKEIARLKEKKFKLEEIIERLKRNHKKMHNVLFSEDD